MSSAIKRTFELLGEVKNFKQSVVNSMVENGDVASMTDNLAKLADDVENKTPKTYILVDANGNEVVATLVEAETVFDATENDIRAGKVAATSKGVVVGEKLIPTYITSEGYRLIPSGSAFTVALAELYDYTKLQVLICPYAGNINGSVAAEKVAINDGLYAVNSTELLATVIKDNEKQEINFGIKNDSGKIYLIRYFTYKEIY